MKEKKREHKEYPVRSFRINDETYKKLQKLRNNKSWNLFLLDLLNIFKERIEEKK